MPRLILLIVLVVLLLGGLFFLSTRTKQEPLRTIEVDVPQGGAQAGNAG